MASPALLAPLTAVSALRDVTISSLADIRAVTACTKLRDLGVAVVSDDALGQVWARVACALTALTRLQVPADHTYYYVSTTNSRGDPLQLAGMTSLRTLSVFQRHPLTKPGNIVANDSLVRGNLGLSRDNVARLCPAVTALPLLAHIELVSDLPPIATHTPRLDFLAAARAYGLLDTS
jgi:hypothetical protein